ncbi:hypothetical protein BVRB_2g038830 [Beta vulgaris subsp. vulgaris]|nr:hypothetical protein BVRB_2g038830 [Beta vulgaris subsp. vulgaris]
MGHHCCSKQKVKRGLWSPEEDEKLVSHITIHGHSSWSSVPKLAGLQRCGKSCRLRWINYLRPDLKRGSFTEEEERSIIEVHRILGNRWAQIAKHLPGRTDNEVKNFWNSCIKKKLLAQGLDPNTHNLLPSNKKKSKTSNKTTKFPNYHHPISSNSTTLVFSNDHDQSQTCYSPNDKTVLQNTINFDCNSNVTQVYDNNAPITELSTQFLASSSSMNISNSFSNDVNLCEYVVDEDSIWSTTTTSLENFEQPTEITQVMVQQDTIGSDQDLDTSLFNMLSLNYGFEDHDFPSNIVRSTGVYDDMASGMDQVAWCNKSITSPSLNNMSYLI